MKKKYIKPAAIRLSPSNLAFNQTISCDPTGSGPTAQGGHCRAGSNAEIGKCQDGSYPAGKCQTGTGVL